MNGSGDARGPHRCAVEGCGVEIERRDFLCASHWVRVPQRLHDDLMRAWRAYEEAGVGDAIKHAGDWYRQARLACVEAAREENDDGG